MRRLAIVSIFVLSTAMTVQFVCAADVSPARPQIPDKQFSITDYGAVGDGKTINTDAIKKAIDACKSAGGGIVVVPAGRFLTGPIDLVSKMNLRVDEGAALVLVDDFDAFPIAGNRHRNAIVGSKLSDIAITGKGTIDGQGEKWWVEFRKVKGKPEEKQQPRRPNLVDLDKCQRVLVQDVLLTNSPMFHLVPRDCTDVTIEGARFLAPGNAPNTDAIDPSGRNFLFKGVTFDVGDDNIAVKPQRVSGDPEHLSCEDFLVTDCTFKHGHGLSIGGQTPGGMRRMTVRNCTFENTDAGIRMKAPRGQGGLVEDLTYENITMKHVEVPIFITCYYPNNTTPERPDLDKPQEMTRTTPVWRNIRISNLTVSDCPAAGRIFGLPESPVENVTLTNVKISAEKGLQIYNAKGIKFVDSEITAAKGPAIIAGNAEVTGLPTVSASAK